MKFRASPVEGPFAYNDRELHGTTRVTLDIRWRLRRLCTTIQGAIRHLYREGPARTAARAARQLREMFAATCVTESGDTDTPLHESGDRPRILIIDAMMPDPSRDSGSLRLCHLMQILRELDWAVDFMPDSLRSDSADKTRLEAAGIRVLCRPGVHSLAAWLQRDATPPDAVMLCRHYVAGAHLALVRKYAPSARILFDTVDLHHVREMRAAQHAGDARQLRRARRTRRRELGLIQQCDITFVVSPQEQKQLQQDLPEADVRLLSNIHHVHPLGPSFEERRGLFFVGGWGHPPNRDAIRWLAGTIMPRIRQQLPEVILHLVGDLPEAERAALRQPGLHIHGRLPDLEPMLQQCRLALAPLRYGAGVKGKINTPMSHGLPVVATTMAVEGMFLENGRDVLVADSAEAFADAVVRAYQDPALWQVLAKGGLENVRAHFSFDAARDCLQAALARGAG